MAIINCMATLRCFFAIPLSHQAEQQLADAVDSMRQQLQIIMPKTSLRWVPPVNYHLTLAFLGDIDTASIEALHLIAQQVVTESSTTVLRFDQLCWFPSSVKPKMLVAMPVENTTLLNLQKRLQRLLRQQGFRVEKRRFRPHVTLARAKAIDGVCDVRDEALAVKSELDELVLFSSQLSQEGARYTPLFAELIQ